MGATKKSNRINWPNLTWSGGPSALCGCDLWVIFSWVARVLVPLATYLSNVRLYFLWVILFILKEGLRIKCYYFKFASGLLLQKWALYLSNYSSSYLKNESDLHKSVFYFIKFLAGEIFVINSAAANKNAIKASIS